MHQTQKLHFVKAICTLLVAQSENCYSKLRRTYQWDEEKGEDGSQKAKCWSSQYNLEDVIFIKSLVFGRLYLVIKQVWMVEAIKYNDSLQREEDIVISLGHGEAVQT